MERRALHTVRACILVFKCARVGPERAIMTQKDHWWVIWVMVYVWWVIWLMVYVWVIWLDNFDFCYDSIQMCSGSNAGYMTAWQNLDSLTIFPWWVTLHLTHMLVVVLSLVDSRRTISESESTLLTKNVQMWVIWPGIYILCIPGGPKRTEQSIY